MAKDSLIVGIDLGSTVTRVAVSAFGKDARPQLIGLGEAPSGGMRRGAIIDLEETIKSLRFAKEQAERASSVKIESAYVSVGGTQTASRLSKGVIAVSRADGEISQEDVSRVLQAASALATPPNREIIHVIPRWFGVDAESGIYDPVGMQGIRLEVDAIVVDVSSQLLRNVEKCLSEAGIEMADAVLDVLAASRSVLTRRQKDIGVTLVDIGGSRTGLVVFEEGNIMYARTLPIGASHITNDIAIGLKTNIDIAERIKLEYGSCTPHTFSKKDTVEFSRISPGEMGSFSRREVAEIIEARVREILHIANKELKIIDHEASLPAGAVLVGSGAKIPGIVDIAKEELRLPAQMGFPADIEGVVASVDDPSYATVVGLALWGRDLEEQKKTHSVSFFSPRHEHSARGGKLKRFFRAFIP